MALELDLDPLGVLEIVDDNLAALLGSHADSMAVRAEANRRKRGSNLDLLHLFAFNDIVEVDPAVQACATQEQVVDR